MPAAAKEACKTVEGIRSKMTKIRYPACQPLEAAQLLHKGSSRESPPQASARGAVIFARASRAASRSCA